VETIFSAVKRKLGETLRARKFRYQIKDIKIKLIVYNINKKVIEIICIKLKISTEPKCYHLHILEVSYHKTPCGQAIRFSMIIYYKRFTNVHFHHR
jgi:hypothetical protein